MACERGLTTERGEKKKTKRDRKQFVCALTMGRRHDNGEGSSSCARRGLSRVPSYESGYKGVSTRRSVESHCRRGRGPTGTRREPKQGGWGRGNGRAGKKAKTPKPVAVVPAARSKAAPKAVPKAVPKAPPRMPSKAEEEDLVRELEGTVGDAAPGVDFDDEGRYGVGQRGPGAERFDSRGRLRQSGFLRSRYS